MGEAYITRRGGGGSAENPYIATTDAEMTAYLTAEYEGQFVKFNGTSTTYANGQVYEITVSGDTTQYFALASLTTPATADDIAEGKEAYNADGVKITGTASGGAVVESDVNFYDYDGTLLQAYTVAQAQAFTELPTPPSHTGLVFQEWNYTLAQVNATTGKLNVGATYTTASGKTEVDITLTAVTGLTCTLQNLTGMTSIDWGDGTTDSLLTHTYADYGDYTIKIAGVTAIGVESFGANTYTNALDMFTSIRLASSITSFSDKSAFLNCYSLKSITIPNSVTSLNTKLFQSCYSLTSVVLPKGITSVPERLFNQCYSLTTVVIPNSVISIGYNAFPYCYSLQSVVIPSSVISISDYAFSYCYSLTSIVIPSSVTSIGNSAFSRSYPLQSIVIPGSVTSIGESAFSGCYACKEYDFNTHTTVPTLANTGAFYNITAICKIKVPAALYDEWIAATNWATYANYIVAV